MTFPSTYLATVLSEKDGPFPLKNVSREPLGIIEWPHMAALIEANVVCGHGTRTRIRFFELTVDQQEYERLATSPPRRERPSLPLDLLVRMCGDRKTTRLERINVVERDGSLRAHFVHAHKGVNLETV